MAFWGCPVLKCKVLLRDSTFLDIQVLEGVKRPQALGFQNDDISKIITLDPISPLVGVNIANNQPDTSPADTLYQQA